MNQFRIDDLRHSGADVVYPTNPLHLVFSLEVFRYIFLFGKFFYQPKEKTARLFVNTNKVTVQLARGQQIGIKYSFILFDILQVALPPNTNRLVFFFGKF